MEQAVAREITFAPFTLDAAGARLLREGRQVPLTPKAFDVLRHLAQRPDQLVTKRELLSAVWSDVFVSDASVKVCVREVRKALEDDPQSPRFIQTVHRRGYRFIAPVNQSPATPKATEPTAPLVGRDSELAALSDCLSRATAGERQIAFVMGPPGTGKTALIESFIRRAEPRPLIAPGHCFEQFGTSEPYLPIWEALTSLALESNSQSLAQFVAGHANPSAPPAQESTEPRLASERLLRDLAAAIEAAAADHPVVLVLEDLHWADYSTLDLITALARRRGPAKLLLVGTYRPGEAPQREAPLRAIALDRASRQPCCELALAPLGQSAVAQYLAQRLPHTKVPDTLPRRLHDRTGGHPLFLASIIDDWLQRHGSGAADLDDAFLSTRVPHNVKTVIQNQFDRLSPQEQQVLEAAAIAGVEFSAAGAAAALAADVVDVERTCDELARRHQFLVPTRAAEWPDGTLANQYRFLHELYHGVVSHHTPAARQVAMHRALANRLETAWATRPGENAAELALHFERGRDFPRALHYLQESAEHATRQYAHREAVDYLRRALAALERLPKGGRATLELTLLKSLAVHLQVTEGFAAPEVRQLQSRAYALCKNVRDTRTTFPVLWGIWLTHKVRSELRDAAELSEKLLALAEEAADPAMLLQARQAISVTSLCLGDPPRTHAQMAHVARLYDPAKHAGNTQIFGQDPCVATTAFGAVALALMNQIDEALNTNERAIALARELAQPSSIALALHFSTIVHQLRGDIDAVQRHATATIDLAAAEGFSFWHAGGTILRGWALQSEEGIAQIRQGIDAWLATGSRTYHTYHLGLLAESLLKRGKPDEALAQVDQALQAAAQMPEGIYEPELHRLKGCCLAELGQDPRQCLEAAGEFARTQGSELFMRRSTSCTSAPTRTDKGRSGRATVSAHPP